MLTRKILLTCKIPKAEGSDNLQNRNNI